MGCGERLLGVADDAVDRTAPIILLSPAKTLDFTSTPLDGVGARETLQPTAPRYLSRAHELAAAVRRLDPARIRDVFDVSEALATEVIERFRRWSGAGAGPISTQPSDGPPAAAPAIRVFGGEAFKAFDAATLEPDDLEHAQRRLRIFSGLYGVLRPLDLIEPHRLDFETPLVGPWGPTVYHAWRDRLRSDICAEAIEYAAASGREAVLFNLASAEYARVLPTGGPCRVVSVSFKVRAGDRLRTVAVFAKQARGLMARWLVTRRIDSPDELRSFHLAGWRFRADLSGTDAPVFVREAVSPS